MPGRGARRPQGLACQPCPPSAFDHSGNALLVAPDSRVSEPRHCERLVDAGVVTQLIHVDRGQSVRARGVAVGRRGLFAELARQQRQNQQAQAAAVRRAAAAEREAERRLRAAAREAQQAARADTRAQVEAERARRLAYTEARVAQTEVKTVSVQARSEGLAQLLAWTLNRDDHVAFERLKKRASHPPFDAKGLDAKLRLPAPPPEPGSTGLGRLCPG
jgi:hypothetical protein